MRGSLPYAFPQSQAIGADDPHMHPAWAVYVPQRRKRAIRHRRGGGASITATPPRITPMGIRSGLRASTAVQGRLLPLQQAREAAALPSRLAIPSARDVAIPAAVVATAGQGGSVT
jgi:hypothetical protein